MTLLGGIQRRVLWSREGALGKERMDTASGHKAIVGMVNAVVLLAVKDEESMMDVLGKLSESEAQNPQHNRRRGNNERCLSNVYGLNQTPQKPDVICDTSTALQHPACLQFSGPHHGHTVSLHHHPTPRVSIEPPLLP